MPMTEPLPSSGSTSWYAWATEIHNDVNAIPTGASGLAFSPAGTVASTDVQAAIVELDTEKLSAADLTPLVGGVGIDITGATISDNTLFSYISTTATLVNNSTTFVDTGLTVAVEASKVYRMELFIGVAAATAADAKFQFVYPAGTTVNGWHLAPQTGATANTNTSARWGGLVETNVITVGTAGVSPTPATDSVFLRVSGLVITSTTAGTFKIQGAQNVADVSNMTLFKGSFMELREVT
jgi:hypothetical protein